MYKSFLNKVDKEKNTSTFEVDFPPLLNCGWWAGVFCHYSLCLKGFANFYSGVHKRLPVLCLGRLVSFFFFSNLNTHCYKSKSNLGWLA